MRDSMEACVLAGGKSSRMGKDKGLLLLLGKPLICNILDLLTSLNIPASIISNNIEYQSLGYPVIGDLIQDKGPMGGLYTALENSKSDYVLLLSCDMPFLSKKAIKAIISSRGKSSIIIAETFGRSNPLLALYHRSKKDEVLENLQNDQLKMQDWIIKSPHFLVKMNISTGYPEEQFLNVNNPGDLKLADIIKSSGKRDFT